MNQQLQDYARALAAHERIETTKSRARAYNYHRKGYRVLAYDDGVQSIAGRQYDIYTDACRRGADPCDHGTVYHIYLDSVGYIYPRGWENG